MPVSFSPANNLDNDDNYPFEISHHSPASLLKAACFKQWSKSDEILQSSFTESVEDILPYSNGFVKTVIEAYSQHAALVIRPDDVWLAILTQFNHFVNGNAELLRSQFVNHDGKKDLKVTAVGTRYTVNFGHMAKEMTTLIHENVIDPNLREWIMPDFSTTTDIDKIVGAILMMSTMKSYFSYECMLYCGIPRVTLEGEKHDWENILLKLEKLKEYGVQTTAWYHLLFPVISRFVKAFDDPDDPDNLEFWNNVAHYESRGSGSPWLSGWITAFCVFSGEGRWLGNDLKQVPDNHPSEIGSLSAQEFWSVFESTPPFHMLFLDYSYQPIKTPFFTLDNSRYHVIGAEKMPCAYGEVDVKLNDNGELFETILTAGLVGMRVSSSGNKQLSETGENDTVRPVTGWWMFTVRTEPRDKFS